MRAVFVEKLTELATQDQRIVLLTGDLGFMALEPFREAHPDRFFNVGVAEQNLMGVATGLADAGFTPYCYSIATFASLRGFEFFRNGAVWHNLPVRLVGMGGGFEYGSAGMTHHALEDIGVMRTLPRVTILAPADAGQTDPVVRYAQTRSGPVYLRLGKDDRRRVAGLDGAFDPARVSLTRRGDAGLVLAAGGIAADAADAVDALAARGVECSFGVVASLAPPPTAHLQELIREHPWVATVEAHVRSGALGSIVADTITDAGLPVRLLRCCVDDPLASERLGSEAFLHELHGLSATALERRLLDFAGSLR
ncbi:MAG: transketolase [Actinomycetota bacterium]|nr:transketolase [Actinomycetota bacterium]